MVSAYNLINTVDELNLISYIRFEFNHVKLCLVLMQFILTFTFVKELWLFYADLKPTSVSKLKIHNGWTFNLGVICKEVALAVLHCVDQ